MFDTMSLEAMQTYRGRQEVPEDFDQFWDELIEQNKDLPNYSLIKKDFKISNINFYTLEFKARNGSIVFSKCIFPKSEKKVPVVFHFHGYQGQSRDWSENLKYIAAGYGVVCMDVRGQAGRSTDMGQFEGMTVKGHVIRGIQQGRENLFYKDVYIDVFQLVEIVANFDFVNKDELYSFGASQGGALALVSAALNSRIKKVVTTYPFLSDFKRVLELNFKTDAYEELFQFFRFSDPFHKKEKEVLNTLSYIDIKNFSHRINCSVCMIVGLDDIVCPPSTQFAIFNRLKCEKEIELLPDYGHEPLYVNVNDFIFNRLFNSEIFSEYF